MAQTQPHRILVVDDDPLVTDSLCDFLTSEGHTAVAAHRAQEAIAELDRAGASPDAPPFGLMVSDINMPAVDGLELLKRVRKTREDLAVIMITGFGKIEHAVEAIKLGATDYLTKPIVDDELRIAVSKAIRQHTLLAENRTLKSQLDERFGLGAMVGADYRMQKVYDLIEAVADTPTTVLVEGESGTGKSMIARAVHTCSGRRGSPFVTMSCGAVPESLLESELFGHVKGAFTGADTDKSGKIQAAHGGTLFIDEINSATPALQLKLLRVLQEKQFERLGSTSTQEVDVRFILATNRPLEALVEQGEFREDLYYRINVVKITAPPLRERRGDIPLLAEHFLGKYRERLNKERTIGDAAMDALRAHDWPGNVRELENAIERAVVLSRRPTITPEDLPETLSPAGDAGRGPRPGARNADARATPIPALADGWTPTPLHEAMREPERLILKAALEANDWNRMETARQLGINRTTLYKKIKQFGLDEPG